MLIKYGFLGFNEPKKAETEIPKKLFEFKVKNIEDPRSDVEVFAEEIYENLNGKDKFRFYAENENGTRSVYQVNFQVEPRSFFEEELLDDIKTFLN